MLGNSNVPVRTHSWGFTACPAAVYVKNKQTDSDLVETYSACSVLYWALWLFGGWAANFLRLLKHFHLWMHRFYLFFFQKMTFLTIFFSFNIIGNFQSSFHYSYWGAALVWTVQLVVLFPLGITLSIMLRQTTSHPFFVILQSSWFLFLLLLLFLLSCFFLLSVIAHHCSKQTIISLYSSKQFVLTPTNPLCLKLISACVFLCVFVVKY